jgi:hypothetical protein
MMRWINLTKPDGTVVFLELGKAYRIEAAPAGSTSGAQTLIWFQGEPPIGVSDSFGIVRGLVVRSAGP